MELSKDKVIFALDVSTRDEAMELIEELENEVGAFKLGLQLFTALGPDLVSELTSRGIKLFLDVKFHDIPNTVAAAGIEVSKLGVWMFNIHAIGGRKMMSETRQRVDEYCSQEGIERPLIIAVTVLTSIGDEDLVGIGFESSVADLAVTLAKEAEAAGLDGVVASGKEASAIKNATSDDFLVITPGVRPSFATNDDQKRVVTPNSAIRNGSDYLVLGRAIRTAENRVLAARAVAGEITSS